MRRLIAALSLALATTASAAPPNPIDALISSMAERLAIADQVALTKWDSGKPVEDKPRERQVIEAARSLAGDYRVDADWAEQFFAAQIEANKLVQYAHLATWSADGQAPDTPRPDLLKDIRPALDTLQKNLLSEMHSVAPLRSTADCQRSVTAAIAAHSHSELQRLALVRASAELCVTRR